MFRSGGTTASTENTEEKRENTKKILCIFPKAFSIVRLGTAAAG